MSAHSKHKFAAAIIALRVKAWYPDAHAAISLMLARRGSSWESAFNRASANSWKRGEHVDARQEVWKMLVVDFGISTEEAATLTDSSGGGIRRALGARGYTANRGPKWTEKAVTA